MPEPKVLVNAAFLDRDGVLIADTGHRTNRSHLKLLPGVAQAIKKFNNHQIPVVVITNQSVIGRGLCSEADVEDIHLGLQEILARDRAHITQFYYCPHHPNLALGKYKIDCECRKPNPGMLRQAAIDLGINLAGSVMVGDNFTDIQSGLSVGCRTVLISNGVDTEDGPYTLEDRPTPDHIAVGLGSAADWISAILGNA